MDPRQLTDIPSHSRHNPRSASRSTVTLPVIDDGSVSQAAGNKKVKNRDFIPPYGRPLSISSGETQYSSAVSVVLEDHQVAKMNEKGGTTEDTTVYPGPLALTFIMVGLSLGVFLVALDQTIISTAIPRITDDFKSIADVGWYGSAYLLTSCSFQPTYGKIYTVFNIKWTFLSAIIIFEIGSLICGVTPNSTVLIIGRAIAGLGCAGIFSGALIVVAHTVPLQRRPLFTGIIGAVFGLASVIGPLLGGVFTDHLSWRWCFYINLPVGAITIITMIFLFTPPERPSLKDHTLAQKLGEIDYIGASLLLPAVILFLLALRWGGIEYPWKSARIIGLFCGGGVMSIIFGISQWWRGDKATIPPRIFKMRTIAASSFLSFMIGSCFLLLTFYLPMYFQAVKGESATKSGVMNIPFVLAFIIMALIAGIAVTIVGYYTPFAIAGPILATIGAGLLTTFKVDTGSPKWMGYQILTGSGVGLAIQQPIMAVQTVLGIDDVPTGTSMVLFFQTVGGAVFVSVGQNLLHSKLLSEITANAPGADAAMIIKLGATGFRGVVDKSLLPIILHAYNDALTKTYTVALGLAAAGILGGLAMEWKSVKGVKLEMSAA